MACRFWVAFLPCSCSCSCGGAGGAGGGSRGGRGRGSGDHGSGGGGGGRGAGVEDDDHIDDYSCYWYCYYCCFHCHYSCYYCHCYCYSFYCTTRTTVVLLCLDSYDGYRVETDYHGCCPAVVGALVLLAVFRFQLSTLDSPETEASRGPEAEIRCCNERAAFVSSRVRSSFGFGLQVCYLGLLLPKVCLMSRFTST